MPGQFQTALQRGECEFPPQFLFALFSYLCALSFSLSPSVLPGSCASPLSNLQSIQCIISIRVLIVEVFFEDDGIDDLPRGGRFHLFIYIYMFFSNSNDYFFLLTLQNKLGGVREDFPFYAVTCSLLSYFVLFVMWISSHRHLASSIKYADH